MKQENSIIEAIKDGLVDSVTNLDKREIKLDSHLKNDLGLDSLSSMFLLTYMEDHIKGFEVNAHTIEARHFNTVQTLHDYVQKEMQSNTINV